MVAASLFMAGCHNHNHDAHDHDHDHDHATEVAHNHDEDHDHDHDHEHEAPTPSNKANEADEHDHEGEIIFNEKQAAAAGVKTASITPGTFHQVIKVSGRIRSTISDESIVTATADGIINYKDPTLSEGKAINSGSTIAYVSAKNLQNGDTNQKLRNAFETAKSEYDRAQRMVKDSILSTKEFEQIQMRYNEARIAYEAQAQQTTAQGVAVTSPISGFIKNIVVNQGSYVSIGQPIATISKNRRLQLEADLPENYFNVAKSINSANFKTTYDNSLYKLKELNGRILSFGKSTDTQNGYLPITFEFDNRGNVLPGSFVEVYLITADLDNVIAIPFTAITEEQGVYFVYLKKGRDVYEKREVKIGLNDGERVQVLNGLQVNEELVTEGAYQVKLAAASAIIPEGHSHNH